MKVTTKSGLNIYVTVSKGRSGKNGPYAVTKSIYNKKTGFCVQTPTVVACGCAWKEAHEIKRHVIDCYVG